MFFDSFRSNVINARVTSVSDVTPNMRRITLASDSLRNVRTTQPGQFVGVTFPSNGVDTGTKPRRFTIRDFDGSNGTLALEFAMHGEAGVASRWALRAQLGDQLVLSKPGRGYAVDTRTPHHLLIGDPTFIPAALEILAMLPADARAFVFLEVASKQDEQRLPSRAETSVTWVHSGNATPGTSGRVEQAVREADHPTKDCQAWVGGESRMVRAVERYLSGECNLGRASIHAHGYWRLT